LLLTILVSLPLTDQSARLLAQIAKRYLQTDTLKAALSQCIVNFGRICDDVPAFYSFFFLAPKGCPTLGNGNSAAYFCGFSVHCFRFLFPVHIAPASKFLVQCQPIPDLIPSLHALGPATKAEISSHPLLHWKPISNETRNSIFHQKHRTFVVLPCLETCRAIVSSFGELDFSEPLFQFVELCLSENNDAVRPPPPGFSRRRIASGIIH
jgi:hypothetical protein